MNDVRIPKSVMWAAITFMIIGICYHFNYRANDNKQGVESNRLTIKVMLENLTKITERLANHLKGDE